MKTKKVTLLVVTDGKLVFFMLKKAGVYTR